MFIAFVAYVIVVVVAVLDGFPIVDGGGIKLYRWIGN